MKKILLIAFSFLSIVFVFSCRGWTTDKPPYHLNPNMDTQPKYKPYRESKFFSDKRDMRPIEPGTVARGHAKLDPHYNEGKVRGRLATSFPEGFKVDQKTLQKGQMKFDVYCAPCHSRTGDGNGMVGRRMTIKPTTFHSDYLHQMPHGHFFDVITNGIRTMPAYGSQVPVEDRWAIVAYIRALQISQKPDLKW